ncbi:MAG: hypothetical protein Q8N90_00850, partial [bacterium]|nr:hypothetical protein [bacterium]
AGLNSAYQSQIEGVRQEKEELVRQAYFVERKSIIQITIETHTWRKTVREVVRAGKKRNGSHGVKLLMHGVRY